MQGGEDAFFTKDVMKDIVKNIKLRFNDCAITLSCGEQSYDFYKELYEAGADRYLLRHETSNNYHYQKLHPNSMSLYNRKKCLLDLKKIGYQIGAGFMVGSPFQTFENIVEDLIFLKNLNPHMVGIGPFIPHKDTKFKNYKAGDSNLTINILSITRLLLPTVLLPATTALGTIDSLGREKAILSGANVIMPNLSPTNVRNHYSLYDNKICTGDEASECKNCIKQKINNIGYSLESSRGDNLNWRRL